MGNCDLKKAAKEVRNGTLYKTRRLISNIVRSFHAVMQEKSLNYAKLAKKLGVSRSRISALFACDRNVTLRTIVAVANALDCDVEVRIIPRSRKNLFSLPFKTFIPGENMLHRRKENYLNIPITIEGYSYAEAA